MVNNKRFTVFEVLTGGFHVLLASAVVVLNDVVGGPLFDIDALVALGVEVVVEDAVVLTHIGVTGRVFSVVPLIGRSSCDSRIM